MFDKWIKNDDGQIIGFSCPYHGEKVLYARQAAFARTDDLVCPACGKPICPECANMFEVKPVEAAEAIDYLVAMQNGSSKAWCGQCGEFGYEYTLKYLKLIGCELPKDYEAWNTSPEDFRLTMTPRVSTLPDMPDIAREISRKFTNGQRGIIKYVHESGEIWGIPEKHPEGWLVTICYPEER